MEHLTHGWEPELDPGDSLLRRFVLANAERSMDLADRAGGRSRTTRRSAWRTPPRRCCSTTPPSLLQPPAYINLEATDRCSVRRLLPPERPFALFRRGPRRTSDRSGWSSWAIPRSWSGAPGGEAPPTRRRAWTSVESSTPAAWRLPDDDRRGLPDAERGPLAARATCDAGRAHPALRRLPRRRAGGDRRGADGPRARGCGMGVVPPRGQSPGHGAALTWAATLTEPSLPAGTHRQRRRPIRVRAHGVCAARSPRPMWHRPGHR